ncbi:hypothetical protein M2267_005729 [Ensifer sp. KUDG1]|uniref:hypothetical protein n=1 Tax=Ensifer sp. KUDG1 TaxID=3373919 RepID=UPI003D244C8C
MPLAIGARALSDVQRLAHDRQEALQALPPPLPDDVNVTRAYIADQLGISLEDFERYHHLGLVSVRVNKDRHLRPGLRHIKVSLGSRLFEATTNARGTILYEALRSFARSGSS